MSTDPGCGVPGEIDARLTALAEAAREGRTVVLPPLLILGTSERVGSNWVSDSLRSAAGQHNEPFRQQIGPDHPWSAVNPLLTGIGSTAPSAIGVLGRHWLVSFAVAKYGPDRQVVKETNLFFALPALLALLPGAPVLVLSRSPLGVVSSFMRGDLFRRWGYRARYQQMVTMTRHGDSRARRFAALVPDDNPADLVALVRLQVLNTVLIAEALAGRDLTHISYEAAVTSPGNATATLTAALPGPEGLTLSGERAPDLPRQSPAGDDTFATTTRKTTLIAGLEPADAALTRATTAASLAAAHDVIQAPVAARAASWLAGDHLYRLEPPRQRTATTRPVPSGLSPAALRYIPKEFYPVEGRPAIVHLLEEIAALGPAEVVIVCHPYYGAFTFWARAALSQDGHDSYHHAARLPAAASPQAALTVSFITQHGPYADITSVLNGAGYLASHEDLYVAFADNLYLSGNPLLALQAAPPGCSAVLARAYQPELAASRGVVAARSQGRQLFILDLAEKPSPHAARALERRYGPGNLLLLEGRARLTPGFIRFARGYQAPAGTEPKLALAIAAYARTHPVAVTTTSSQVIDLGTGPPARTS